MPSAVEVGRLLQPGLDVEERPIIGCDPVSSRTLRFELFCAQVDDPLWLAPGTQRRCWRSWGTRLVDGCHACADDLDLRKALDHLCESD